MEAYRKVIVFPVLILIVLKFVQYGVASENADSHFKQTNQNEADFFKYLMEDEHLKPFVPELRGVTSDNGKVTLEMENLKSNMEYPIMFMDLKLGTRTYVATEEGVDDIHRPDLLAKLQAALPNAVKPEYAQKFTRKMFADIRASESSTGALSFRIGTTGKWTDQNSQPTPLIEDTLLWQTKTEEQIISAFEIYTEKNAQIIADISAQVEKLDAALKETDFLRKYALIGGSLLFLHDGKRADVRMIDFAKAIQSENDDIGTQQGVANILRILKSMAPN